MFRSLRLKIYRSLLYIIAELIAFDGEHNCCTFCQERAHCANCLDIELLQGIEKYLDQVDFVEIVYGRG